MNKLSTEDVAHVFRTYIGQKCSHKTHATSAVRSIMGIEGGTVYLTSYLYERCALEFKDVVIHLTPLSKITDEHAIDIASILDVGGDCVERHKNHIAVYDRYNDNANVMNTLRLHFIGNYELLHLDEMGRSYEFDLERCSNVHQYLISKGYAVSLFFGINHWANGKTAIDLEIALDKTLTPQP